MLSGSPSRGPIDYEVFHESARTDVDFNALLERTRLASTPEACEACLPEIARALESVTAPAERGRLLICRARARSFQLLDREACEDAAAAMTLFEVAGDTDLALDAASLEGAARSYGFGNVHLLASDLAARSILGLGSVAMTVSGWRSTNRLGIFCYYYLGFGQQVERFEFSLAAAPGGHRGWQ